MNYKYNDCLGCQKRTVGCHGKCPEYLAYCEANKKEREETRKRQGDNHSYKVVRFGRTYKIHQKKERK